MGADPKKLLTDAMNLSPEQRAELASKLLASLTPPETATDDKHAAEIIKRVREVAVVLRDWEEVLRDLEQRFGKR